MYPATVEGVVIHKHADLNGGATYRPEITYSYEVKGEYFGGNYGCDLCTSEDEADLVSELFPKGTKLQVHVHPEKPHVSVLDVDGDHP